MKATKGFNEEQVMGFITKSMGLPGVRVNREKLLRKELGEYYPEHVVEKAIVDGFREARISRKMIDKMIDRRIEIATRRTTAISAAAGIPGGLAMIGTVPADLIQYFGALFKILQEIVYLNGGTEIDLNNIDEYTKNEVIVFMGIMFGVDAANKFITSVALKSSQNFAKKATQKIIFRSSLGGIYPIAKQICKAIGIKLSKQAFTKSASKVVPILGGVMSGGLTYVTFKPCAKRLKEALKDINLRKVQDEIRSNFEEYEEDSNLYEDYID